MATDPLDLAALERLAVLEQAATPGEWWHDRSFLVAGRDEQTAVFNAHCGDTSAEWATDADLDFVCAVRNAAPALLDLARAAMERRREVSSLRERLELAKTPCRCDPPGSGEEYCTGHCELNAEIGRLRKIISDTMSAGNDALTGHMSSPYAVQVMRGMLREEATKIAEEEGEE